MKDCMENSRIRELEDQKSNIKIPNSRMKDFIENNQIRELEDQKSNITWNQRIIDALRIKLGGDLRNKNIAFKQNMIK